MNRTIAAQRTCTLQGIPARVDIFGNERANNLAKDARNGYQFSNSFTLTQ